MAQINPQDCTLDISSPNFKLVDYVKDEFSNVLQELFRPKEGVTITRVCDGETVICECEEPVKYAKLLHKEDKQYLFHVNMKVGSSKYFINPDGNWTKTTFGDYIDYETYLMLLGKPEKHISLDVNKPDDTCFYNINQLTHGNKNQLTFYPKSDYYVRAVVDGDKTIWKAENDAQRCMYARVLYDQTKRQLLSLHIGDLKGTKRRYYQSLNGTWKETDANTYLKITCSYNSNGLSLNSSYSESRGIQPTLHCCCKVPLMC